MTNPAQQALLSMLSPAQQVQLAVVRTQLLADPTSLDNRRPVEASAVHNMNTEASNATKVST